MRFVRHWVGLALPLGGRQGFWGGTAKSWWWPVHSKSLLGSAMRPLPETESATGLSAQSIGDVSSEARPCWRLLAAPPLGPNPCAVVPIQRAGAFPRPVGDPLAGTIRAEEAYLSYDCTRSSRSLVLPQGYGQVEHRST